MLTVKKRRSLSQSFKNALVGLAYCFRTQPNFRIHLTIAVLVLILAKLLMISRISLALLFFGILLVIVLEMINTAFEAIVDLLSPVWQQKAKIAKDVAAAAVLVIVVGAMIIGIIIFYPYLNHYY